MRALLLAAALSSLGAAARADAMSDRLCPILKDVAAAACGAMIPEAVQANLVIDVASAYDHDDEALQAVLAEADASTAAACPDARAAVLEAVAKPSLEAAMR